MTYLFFVDESRDSQYHYHLGLLAEGDVAARVEAALNDLSERAIDLGATSRWRPEFHAVDIFHGNGEWTKGTIPLRAQVLEEALETISRFGVEVIARGVNLAAFGKRYTEVDPYGWEFSNLLERLNERLTALGAYGLVIADQQHEYAEGLRYDLSHAKQYGTGGYRSQKLERIIDTAHFVDSHRSRMVQLADLAAFVLRRRASRCPERDARLEALMSRLATSVEHGVPCPTGQYHTIRY